MQPRAWICQRALRTSAPPHFASGSGGFEHIHVLNPGMARCAKPVEQPAAEAAQTQGHVKARERLDEVIAVWRSVSTP